MRREDKEELRLLIREVVADTVVETLQHFGMRADAPLELQADMAYLAKLRRGAEEVKGAARSTVIRTCVGALLATLIYQAAVRLGIDIKLPSGR